MGGAAETALIIGTLAATGATVYNAQHQPKPPKLPKPPVQIKAPDTAPLADQSRRRLASGGLQSTILTTPIGLPPASAGYATKLGA